jgi:molybdopterin-guanine dinucleotide biosynthesis protein A
VHLTGYVLAGGKSSRMGRDKGLLEIDGDTLLRRAVTALKSVANRVKVVGDHPHLSVYGEVVRDVHKDCGPLGGIEAALSDTDTEWNLILAVDQFRVPVSLLRLLIARAGACGPECLAVVPQVTDRPEPLCAVYRKAFGPVASAAIERAEYKIGKLFPAAHALILPPHEVAEAGVDASDWLNVNTPDDFETALQRARTAE